MPKDKKASLRNSPLKSLKAYYCYSPNAKTLTLKRSYVRAILEEAGLLKSTKEL